MKQVIDCLLIQRKSDGMYFTKNEGRHTTSTGFTKNPEDAFRILPNYHGKLDVTKPPTWYLENSDRARNWVVGCKTVAYRITVVTEAEVITDPLGGDYPTYTDDIEGE